MQSRKELLKKGRQLSPSLRIGKSGLNEEIIKEIKLQLKKKKMVKVKFLRSYIENKNKREEGLQLAKRTNSEFLYSVGFVVVLYKK